MAIVSKTNEIDTRRKELTPFGTSEGVTNAFYIDFVSGLSGNATNRNKFSQGNLVYKTASQGWRKILDNTDNADLANFDTILGVVKDIEIGKVSHHFDEDQDGAIDEDEDTYLVNIYTHAKVDEFYLAHLTVYDATNNVDIPLDLSAHAGQGNILEGLLTVAHDSVNWEKTVKFTK